MNTEKIKELLEKYFEGETSLEEEQLLRDYFQNQEVPDELKSYRDQFAYLDEFGQAEPEGNFDPFEKINIDKKATKSPLTPCPTTGGKGEEIGEDNSRGLFELGNQLNTKLTWTLRIAAGLILLLAGFSAGLLVNRQQGGAFSQEVAALQQEIQQMKTVLVYGSEEQITASERISAINLAARVPENSAGLDREITDILVYTMNNDQNINVREAAAEALFRFRSEPRIRKALVHSLSQQSDPLMQMTLINMLVELKEKSAINEMQKLLMDSGTLDVVKTRLEVGIAELKT